MAHCCICKKRGTALVIHPDCLEKLLLAVRALAPDICDLCASRQLCQHSARNAHVCRFLPDGAAIRKLIEEAKV